jgi:sugar lactone lactonase YvrE
MTDNDRQLLLRIVWDRLNCGKQGGKQRHVEQAIFDAHNGRPDGFLVTTDNMWLFRQYRNSVSPSPKQLVHEAMDFYREESVR